MSTTNTNPAATGGCSGGGGVGVGGGSGGTGPCGACKFLRRKCVAGCIFAPYFDSEQGAAHFAAVHKVFGASNVSKLLLHIPVHKRVDAVVTICYEAQARLRDPVYGCVAHIFALQQQVVNLQAEVSCLQAHLTTLELPTPPPQRPPLPPQGLLQPQQSLSIADLPTASTMPPTYDLSSLFDPMVQQSSWTMPVHQRLFDHHHSRQFGIENNVIRHQPSDHIPTSLGGGDFQVVASELLHGHSSTTSNMHVPCTEGLPS